MLAIAFLSCLYIVRAHGLSLQLPFSFGGRAPIFNPDVATTLNFELRHVHGLNIERGRSVFRDVPASSSLSFSTLASGSPRRKMRLQSKRIKVHRPRSQHQFHAARQQLRLRPKQNYAQSWRVDWNEDEIDGPDVRDRETLLLLAKMTNDAYLSPGESGWYDLGENWNASYPFGWEPDADGFRGHIFATPDNSTVVLSIKGTSPKVLGGGPTSKKDKLNDNLLWSCCCARVDWSWTPVCGCYSGSNKCDQDCLEESLQDESLFYSIGTNLYNNVTHLYPNSIIWLTGHSLGGGLASLMGITFGVPVVAFEAPGEKMAAQRLHLPSPPSTHHIMHLYHNADPVPIGVCTGPGASCYYGGYALETRCHLGKSIVYDTVNELKWAVDIRTHTITTVIEQVLSKEDLTVPEPKPEDDCVECYTWEYGDFKNTTTEGGNNSLACTRPISRP